MTEKERTYIAIDLKSFYASVECKERNRDPLTTNLVVADKSRTEKTIWMGDIARCSIGKENELYNEDLLYKLFGVNAELLIDHAWGYESCTMKMVKAYKPETNSVCSGQVLHCPYDFEKAKLVVKEMTDQMFWIWWIRSLSQTRSC